jgi:uncharacterized protein (DUF1015 family)
LATVFPFQPFRYTPKAGDLNHLITQPYDKITPAMRARYLSLSPYNLVRVILGEPQPGDNESNNVYTRAAAHLDQWTADGILAREDAPSFYAYFQEFTPPDSDAKLVRKSFIALGAVEDYSAGVVHRHEQTLSGPKKDRLEMLRRTRAQCELIFMLYPDKERRIDAILDEASRSQPDAAVTDEYGAVHRVWRIASQERIDEIRRIMADKKLLIADGHHRYETALAFRAENPRLEDAARVPMAFVNMYSEGLTILPTHRVVSGLAGFDVNSFIENLPGDYSLHRFPTLEDFREAMNAVDSRRVRIGMVARQSPRLYVLERHRSEGELDVRILHDEILGKLLGISEADVRDERNLRYVRGLENAIKAVREDDGQIAFLLQPVSVEDVARVSFGGGVMPQKSTDFYPKLLSGFTIYRIEK